MTTATDARYPHLGTGWAFPPRWTPAGAALVSGLDDLEEAIGILVRTEIGSRVMQPRFGSNAARYVFDSQTSQTLFDLQYDIGRALLLWEPRVIVESVTATGRGDEGRIDVDVVYAVESHRRPRSLVVPFYLDEPA